MSEDGLYVPLREGDLALQPLTESHREGLRAACAQDDAIWDIYPFNYAGADFDPQFDRLLAGGAARRIYAIEHGGEHGGEHAGEHGGEIVGMSGWLEHGAPGWSVEIGNSYIEPRLRGTGFNGRLKRLMLGHAFACGLERALVISRDKRDPLELDMPERRVMLDDKGRIAEIKLRERLDAHRVVEDFMIAANVAAAKALESKVAPIVYRLHEPPSREKLVALKDYLSTFEKRIALGQVITPSLFNRLIKDIADEAEKALIMEAVLRSQTQAYYGPNNVGHFGLALGSYAHFTSPIRRYADLLVHRALVDAFALEQPAPKGKLPATSGLSDRDRDDLGRISEAISNAERRAMVAERETLDRYVAAWLASRVGEVFATRVTGVQKFGFFATIIGLGGDGLVPVSTLGVERFSYDEKSQVLEGEQSGTRYAVGDFLQLRLAEANPLTGALKFELEEGGSAPVEPRGRPLQLKHKGKHVVGKRGRPGNIRHQGKRR